jgi:hypothetical protein
MEISGNTSISLITGTSGVLTFRNSNIELGKVFSTGNFLLQTSGSLVDAGYKLDVIGSARVKGAGTTSATTALTVQNANASSSLVVLDNGNVYSNGPGFVASNTAFGSGSLASNTTGIFNTAFGISALSSNTTSDNNTAIGNQALR